MKFSCFDRDLQTILTSGYYRVPRFQRPYSWTQAELEDFWGDVIIDGERGYFIGGIVLFKEERGAFGIVDGQQRLTTITMLLCVIRNAFSREGLEGQAKGLHALIERPDIDSLPQFVLQTATSYPFFQEHIQKRGAPEVPEDVGDEEEALRAAFVYLEKQLRNAIDPIRADSTLTAEKKLKRVEERLTELRDRLLSLTLILVELDDEDDAYIAFETLNARGKDLRVSDLLKNHLARHLKKKTQTVDTFRHRWDTLVEIIEGSTAKISLDEFIHHYWLSKYDYTSGKKLFRAIKKTIGRAEAGSFLNSLIDEAPLYRAIFELGYGEWGKHERAIEESLRALRIFQVRQATPLILAVLAEYRGSRLNKSHVELALRAVEVFHFEVTAIASQSSSGGISAMYAAHARSVRQQESTEEKVRGLRELQVKLRDRLPSFDEFLAGFMELRYSNDYTRDRGLVRYTLGKITREGVRSSTLNFWDLTLEHLEPQSSTRLPGELVASIGNLLLAPEDVNARLRDRTFAEKKRIAANSRDVWIDDDVKSAREWSGQDIEARSVALARLGYEKVWRI